MGAHGGAPVGPDLVDGDEDGWSLQRVERHAHWCAPAVGSGALGLAARHAKLWQLAAPAPARSLLAHARLQDLGVRRSKLRG